MRMPNPPSHPHPLARCRYSEQSRTKCIGMTIETRPDFCLTPHLSQMLSYGCTRLEIGLQARPRPRALKMSPHAAQPLWSPRHALPGSLPCACTRASLAALAMPAWAPA